MIVDGRGGGRQFAEQGNRKVSYLRVRTTTFAKLWKKR